MKHRNTAIDQTGLLLTVLLLTTLSGCGILRKTSLRPVPPPVSSEEVIDNVRRNTERFRTLVDSDISLYLSAKQAGKWDDMPSMGGLLVFDSKRPGLWMRAEKLGQKIFSLRAGTDYFWLELPDSREVVRGGTAAYNRLPHLIQPSEAMLWFAAPEWLGMTWDATEMSVEPEHYRYDVYMSGQIIRQIYINRRTMNLNRIKVFDFFGRMETEVRMDQYAEVKDVSFPFRMVVLRPRVGYRIELRLDSPQFNKNIPGKAFEPRERPGWEEINLDYESIHRIEAFQ